MQVYFRRKWLVSVPFPDVTVLSAGLPVPFPTGYPCHSCRKGNKTRHRFGQSPPPLVEYLQDILNRYPDGGQILKELIQNAEDAEASEVRFLYDRTQYGTRTLHSPKLAPFQGPALCAYNDACFTEEDWKNIQNTARSVKKGDPMKIGRFGLGFNSVYHLTDLPMILSGQHVAILDPHESIFLIDGVRQSGRKWHLKDDAEEIKSLQDQFSPFKNLFESAEDPFKTGFFNGTIFRFPLRQTSSRLSKTIYGDQKVVDLFDSFKADGDIVLLFMHHVRSIKLMTREATGHSATDYRVSMSSQSGQERENSFTADVKEALKTKVDNRETIVSTCRFSVEIDGEATRDWLVTSYVKGRGISEEARELSEELSLLPWVGVAMPLSGSGDGKLAGRTFCCLPLPAGHESTGLPVHVHGFFGVSDNRRSLKWTGTDQKSDSAARWNEVLVREILPAAYARLITDATRCSTKDTLYAALPDQSHTAPHWDKALTPFFADVLTQKVVWTSANGGRWITQRDAVFNRTSVSTAVLDYLVGAGIDVVTLPDHVMQAIDDTFSRYSLKEVTPGLLRVTLKKTGVHNSSRKHKLAWLQYALDDNKYDEMEGIELLPLADKTFTTFSKYDKTTFIESEEHPRTLLPGLQGRFLDTDKDINKPTLHHLRAAATEAEGKSRFRLPCLQLRHLAPQLVATHLRDALPPDWLQVSHVTWNPARAHQPPKKWLPQLWQYLQVHFPNDLSPFVGVPLLPIHGINATSLVRLEHPSKVIRPKYGETTIPDVIKKLVRNVDATVLEDVPPYLNHPKLEEFVHRCTPPGLLTLLHVVGADRVMPKVNALNPEAKGALRAFFAKADHLHDTELAKLLAKLPIFEAVDDTNLKSRYLPAFEPGGRMRQIAPDLTSDPLPEGLSFPTTLIITKDLDSQALGRLVGLQQLSITQLLLEMTEKVRRGDYTREQTDFLMLWILKNLHTFKRRDPSIINRIQTLEFVTTNINSKVTPADLFSPEEAVSDVLLGEPVFPGPPYADRIALTALLELGMRQKLSAQDILHSARNVQSFYGSGKLTLSEAKRKAFAIMSVLVHEMLTARVHGALLTDALMGVNFLPVSSKRPRSYLPGLPWYPEANNSIFVSPKDARGSECSELVGATMPIVDGKVPDGFISALGWEKNKLPIGKVIGQLKIVCDDYARSERPAKHHFVQILTEIYQHIDARLSAGETAALNLLSSPEFPPWLWQGNGLAAPNTVALTSPFNLTLDLAPYRFILPEEFRDFKQMFRSAGVKESIDESDLVQTLHDIQSAPKMSVERDLKLSVDIIGWLVNHPDILEEVIDDILVPIATKDKSRLTLAPVSECTYNDVSWSDAQDILDDEDEEFKPLHKLITLDTAQLLEVPSLSQRFVNAEEFGYDQCGQHEKVTQRLKNILNDYPEGAGIFKELIQNADDAGATEVKFLVDWRSNEDSRGNLIDQGMSVCHGPALWAFNNAAFSEEGFKNIQNLGGQTKLEALEKVGRFGVGFNSVYHVTDVPSFVSGSRVLFFDPHATHLSNHIKDKSRPGIGLDLQKNTRLVSRFKDQFKPFHGVFGYSTETSYNGTLFRLPLRTPQEASESEISDVVYSKPDNANMERLIESFKKGLKPLLLFTQNVRHVTMYKLGKCSDPSRMVETFHVFKSPIKYLREMQISLPSHKLSDRFQVQSNCLLATSDAMKHQGANRVSKYPETSMVVKVTCQKGKDNAKSEEWIISSCMGTETSLKLALSESGRKAGLVPCGGVAALLKSADSSHQTASIDTPPSGEAFCFLPLSIRTGLPVHVNGSFAVASNRRGLWEETSTDRYDLKVEWNKALMHDAVCKAYVTMLLDLSAMAKKGQLTPYQYHSFWPNPCHVTGTTHYSVLVKAFYATLSSEGKPPPLFESEGQWLSFTSTVFLHPEISFSSSENVAARKALQQCLSGYTVVELPKWARQGFEEAGCGALVSDHTYTEERFYSELFFPRIHELSHDIRDPLMLRILSRESEDYHELIKTTACIPTSPRGQELSRPGDLIHPKGKVSAMFLPEDKKFPHGSTETYMKPSRLEVLTELGMCKDDVPWEVVIERAKSVVGLNNVNQNESRKRIVALMDFIVKKGKEATDNKQREQVKKQLSTIPFLPIMQPATWREKKKDMVFCHKDMSRGLAVDTLGVKPVRHKALEAYSHSLSCFGSDFGQVEKLTNRIKHLLDAYPFGKEILKELLQNADDAGATEIHFVYDKRQHGTERIFDDSWKELQGPALCVYNNRPFTEVDLIGIQNLGEGSKAQDPVKTGKYGVGFNAVYHLTDCPSFMTGGDTLCVFDPQLRFVPGARLDHPGRMFRGIDDYLRQQYKDVFDCYLKDKPAFSSPESTIFRFPLRTTASDLSDKKVTEEVVMDLLHRFKSESFEVLLFLNSVEKIKISIIERNGTLREFYHAEALISNKAKQDRKKFADHVAQCAHSEKPLHALPTHHVTYNMDLRDGNQHQETWIVHQRIGFEDKDIPNSIKEAHAAKELGLLPRGGAAVCHHHCKQPYQSKSYHKCHHAGPKRAFCFLPLPIETKLPVHVNGHFALDHEARRNLWRDENGGMKSDWNKTLIKEVIAPAYAAVLDRKRAADFGVEQRSSSASNSGSVYRSLEAYHNLFPSVSTTTDQWRELSEAFYQHIDRKHLRLLPVLRTISTYSQTQGGKRRKHSDNQQTLEWLPPTGSGREEAFFNTVTIAEPTSTVPSGSQKSRRQVLVETLLDLGFNLLSCPQAILDSFRQAGVKVQGTQSESVVRFLQTHTYTADDPLCRIGASLPAPITTTTFKQPERLMQEITSLFADWAVLPASTTAPTFGHHHMSMSFQSGVAPVQPVHVDRYLAPLCKAHTVVNFNNQNTQQNTLAEILRKLHCLELDADCLGASSLPRRLVPRLTDHVGILRVLHFILVEQGGTTSLKANAATELLRYFEDEVETYKPVNLHMLRSLPLYETIHNKLICLTNTTQCHVLPVGIPTIDMEEWIKRSGTVFLKKWYNLTKLHKALGCSGIENADVYQRYILPNMHHLSDDAVKLHLKYLRDLVQKSEEEPRSLIESLKRLPVIPSPGGRRPVSDFYDENHPVFREMVPAENFLPQCYRSGERRETEGWRQFFIKTGLNSAVTNPMFLQYAREVERLAKATRSEESQLTRKSNVLIEHFFNTEILSEGNFIEEVVCIRFIAPVKARGALVELHSQYGVSGDVLPFVCFKDSFRQLQNLYLPSRQNKLRKTTELVFDDTPQFSHRIKDFKYPFLVRLSECDLRENEQELINLLPAHLSPKRCSSLVQETLCDECEQMACVMGENCVLETRFNRLFRSSQFSQAIHRLVATENSQNVTYDAEKLKTVSSIKVCCRQNLVTRLMYREFQEEITESKDNSLCFIEDGTLYIAHKETTSEQYNAFIYKLIHVINYALGRPLEDPSPLMLVLSTDVASDIPGKLDKAGIQRHGSGKDEDQYRHDLGTQIPEIYHHLLKSNPAHFFSQDEYVGFEVYDSDLEAESEDYTMSFLYAKVIKEASSGSDLKFGLGRKYVIDLGQTEQTVSAADLYKFCRPNVSGPLVPYEGETGEDGASAVKTPQSLEEAMEEVSDILEEAWKLPEKERKKVVRRLYLQWHPDKNPDNVEMATEVCKHIQAEIGRLEKGLPRKKGGGRRSGGFDFGESSFSSFFKRWNFHARFHSQQRERFHEHYRGDDFSGWHTGSGQWVPPRSDGHKFPNPREAARWHRQATADLQAARDNLRAGSSHEWTCVMSHQAVEKALKAVQLGKFGKYQMVHRIGRMAKALMASCGEELADVGDTAMELSSIGSYPGSDDVYLRARYPNLHPAPRVPNDVFTCQHAERAVHLAQTVLGMTEIVLK
ncbi:SACS [Branchiostoma lanceolatum]|uniref:SACS protein n=1 Tax=Branchiostoma lanceolatum TaxID=7740 RepID=A0A8J9ZDE7_BRALA|nr:SACS [Branchiostoma lanceolatum]